MRLWVTVEKRPAAPGGSTDRRQFDLGPINLPFVTEGGALVFYDSDSNCHGFSEAAWIEFETTDE